MADKLNLLNPNAPSFPDDCILSVSMLFYHTSYIPNPQPLVAKPPFAVFLDYNHLKT